MSRTSTPVALFLKTLTTIVDIFSSSAPSVGQVLRATSSTSATWQDLPASTPAVTNAQVGTTYTFVLTDQSKLVTFTNASPIAVTIPTNASVAFPIDTQIDCSQNGAGKVTFSGAGVTINSLSSLKSIAGQYVGVTLKKTGTDTWTLYGNLIA